MKKVVTILGARPQFVKAAVLSRIISQHNEIEEVIVHTGQHFDENMSAVFFREMQIPKPSYNLDVNNLGHAAMTGQMMEKIGDVLEKEKPDAVVVYGDTNSTIAGAIAAKKTGIKVVHVEAGLRSFNMDMPEEINRILTDRISDLLICPTKIAVENLKSEGFDSFPAQIEMLGDIMKDAVEFYSQTSDKMSSIIEKLSLESHNYVLATVHRQENTDSKEKLQDIFSALEHIHDHQKVILPLHPRTRKMLEIYNINTRVICIDPVGYFDMLELLKYCSLVVTDSGGLQKEAFFNKKHSIIIREETEWKELVTHDYAKVVGTNKTEIEKAFQYFIQKTSDFNEPLYGNNVGTKIYRAILNLM